VLSVTEAVIAIAIAIAAAIGTGIETAMCGARVAAMHDATAGREPLPRRDRGAATARAPTNPPVPRHPAPTGRAGTTGRAMTK
jgi:hypothetical protein